MRTKNCNTITLVFAAVMVLAILGISQPLNAAPITIGSTTFDLGDDAFPSSVNQLSGSTPGVFGGISATEGLTGADIDTGALNLVSTQVFELTFPVPIVNQPGDDIYFTDAHFSIDALDFSLDGGSTFNTIAAGDFADTGVDSTLRNTSFDFDLFSANIDMSDFGFASEASITTIQIRGVLQSDPIVIGNLNSVSVVPEPSTLLLLGSGLACLGILRRRRKTA